MVPTVIITDIPDTISVKDEGLNIDKPWFIDKTPPTKYKFSLKTGTYEGTMEPQASPLEPGVYFDYEFAVDHSPESVCGAIKPNQEYFWNKEKGNWDVRLSVMDNPVYNKRDRTRVDTPHPDLREHYTFSKPKGNYSIYNEETDTWVIDYNLVINSYKAEIDHCLFTLNGDSIEYKGKKLDGVDNLNEYVTMYNASKPKENIEFYTSEGELLSLTREELGEFIEIIKIERSENMNAIKYFKDELEYVNDKESLTKLLTFETKTKTKIEPTKSMIKLAKMLISNIEVED